MDTNEHQPAEASKEASTSPEEVPEESSETTGKEAATLACSVTIPSDHMSVLFTGEITPETLDEMCRQVRAEMLELGISNAISLDNAEQRLRDIGHAPMDLEDYHLLDGIPPTPPEDAKIEWSRDFFKKGFAVDPVTGAVDYRKQLAKRTVEEGEQLAQIYPPEEGKEGIDIFGKPVPPREPKQVQLKAGSNVRHDEDEDTYYATCEGRIRYTDNAVHVDDVYVVSGSVGLETGHINHPGALVVTENVDADSRIETKGDIEVNGYIEDAEIICGGSVIIHGGIAGGEGCKIKVAGELHAHFIQNADIEAGGDVVVDREVDQSTIKTHGALLVPDGRIVGGRIISLRGIDAGQIGSDGGIHTEVNAGEDFMLRPKIRAIEEDIEKEKEQLKTITEKIAPLKERCSNLPPKVREAYAALVKQVKGIQEFIQENETEIERLRKESKKNAKHEILIRKFLHSDTFIELQPLSLLIRDSFKGPVKAAIIEGELRIVQARLHSHI